MISNYHTHTTRCNHASGTEREYIEAAIKGGFATLGFSDHTPMPFPPTHRSGYRMRLDEAGEYIDTIKALRDEYKDKINIKIGFEVEYFPALFDSLLSFLSDYEYDYLILGQHFNENEYDSEHYNGIPTDNEKILERFYSQMLEAWDTGKFSYIAHPDLLKFTGDGEIYKKHTREFCLAAAERGILLEINVLGITLDRHYPQSTFWDIAAECGCSAIIGFDAHIPNQLENKASYEKARKIAESRGIKLIESLEI